MLWKLKEKYIKMYIMGQMLRFDTRFSYNLVEWWKIRENIIWIEIILYFTIIRKIFLIKCRKTYKFFGSRLRHECWIHCWEVHIIAGLNGIWNRKWIFFVILLVFINFYNLIFIFIWLQDTCEWSLCCQFEFNI